MKIALLEKEIHHQKALCEAITKTNKSTEITVFSEPEALMDYVENKSIDVLFMELPLQGLDGIEFAEKLMEVQKRVNVIFCTTSAEYAYAALRIHASGYLIKPYEVGEVARELENLRYPVEQKKRVFIQCFGNFEIYADGKPIEFSRERSKEVMAYLVDRNGATCTNAEIIASLWEDDNEHISYMQKIRQDIKATLKKSGCGEIIQFGWGKMKIYKDLVSCDYYDWLEKKNNSDFTYRGEYMRNYTWAEYTNGKIAEL